MVEMIKLYDASGIACNPITKFLDLTITETLNTVYTIEFEVPIDDPVSQEIKIEGFLECDAKRFTIKEITQRLDNGTIGVYGMGDCDGLKYTRVKQFSVEKKTVGEALTALLKDRNTGWTWRYGSDEYKPTAKRTLKLTKADAGSIWANVQKIIEKWNVEIYFDCVNHVMVVYKVRRLGQQSALTVFYEDLNLNDFERTSNSDDVYNEIIAYGKNDITVKGAKREDGTTVNVTYVNEVNDLGREAPVIPKKMRGYYLDTQEDDVQELYDAAVAYLEKHAYTEKNYTINVADLSEINPNYAEFYEVSLGDTVGISSKTLNGRYNLRVVKITRKPNEVGSMELELTNKKANTAVSTAAERRIVNSMIDTYKTPVVGDTILVGDNAIGTDNIVVDAITSDLIQDGAVTEAKMGQQAVDSLIESTLQGVQENLSNAPEGRFQIIYNEAGSPIGIKIIDASNANNCWYWDYGGLRFSADGGSTFRNVAIDYEGNIVASTLVSGAVLSNAVTAKNLKIEGGSVNIDTSKEQGDEIKLNYRGGFAAMGGNYFRVQSATSVGTYIGPGVINVNNATLSGADGLSCQDVYADNGTFTNLDGTYLSCTRLDAGGNITGNKMYVISPGSISDSNSVLRWYESNGQICKTSSSRRWKRDIEDVKDENINPNKLYNVPVRQFRYNPGTLVDGTDDVLRIGFIAEEIDEIFPLAACHDDEGKPSDWTERPLIPAMLKLIQDQKKQIDILESRLAEIEKKL